MSIKQMVCVAAFAALALFSASGLAAERAVESRWAPLPVNVDGMAQEWDDSPPVIDENSQVQYALMNDDRNIYIIMVFKSQNSMSTLDYTGMKIYFNAMGKKSKDNGVLFLKKQLTADGLIASLEKKGEVLPEERKAEIRKQKTYIIFSEEPISPKSAPAPSDPAVQDDPPIFRTTAKGQIAVYEFRIPLSRVNQIGGISVQPGQSVKMGFEWGGMTNQIMRDMMAGRADRSVSAQERAGSSDTGWQDTSGDGGGGFESRAGRIPASEFGRDPRYKKRSFWIDAKLAVKG